MFDEIGILQVELLLICQPLFLLHLLPFSFQVQVGVGCKNVDVQLTSVVQGSRIDIGFALAVFSKMVVENGGRLVMHLQIA